jgi:hypothetical protein
VSDTQELTAKRRDVGARSIVITSDYSGAAIAICIGSNKTLPGGVESAQLLLSAEHLVQI